MKVNGSLNVAGFIRGKHIFNETDSTTSLLRGANINIIDENFYYKISENEIYKFLSENNIINLIDNKLENINFDITSIENISEFYISSIPIEKFFSECGFVFFDETINHYNIILDFNNSAFNFKIKNKFENIFYNYYNNKDIDTRKYQYNSDSLYFRKFVNDNLLENFSSVIQTPNGFVDNTNIYDYNKNFVLKIFDNWDITNIFNNYVIFTPVDITTIDITFLPYKLDFSSFLISYLLDKLTYNKYKKYFYKIYNDFLDKNINPIFLNNIYEIFSSDNTIFYSIYLFNPIDFYNLQFSYIFKIFVKNMNSPSEDFRNLSIYNDLTNYINDMSLYNFYFQFKNIILSFDKSIFENAISKIPIFDNLNLNDFTFSIYRQNIYNLNNDDYENLDFNVILENEKMTEKILFEYSLFDLDTLSIHIPIIKIDFNIKYID